MLSSMCHDIIVDTVVPGALDIVTKRRARLERQSAQKAAWMGRMLCQDILFEILDIIETMMLLSICKDIITETV